MDGFVIERIRDDFIEGRFIEKYAYQEIVADPFGTEEVIERTGYRSTDFTLFSQFPYIELRNGQRSIKEFVNRLLQACNFTLVVSPVTVNLMDWVSSFQRTAGHRILVDSVQVSGVALEEGITGKILLKGDRDVREAIDNIVGGKRYTLEKVQIKIDGVGKNLAIHLANNGTAKIPPDHTSELLPLLRQSFPKGKG
ncbi:hypothetical protein WI80_04070 [Burkholderia ubonensis]|nr:hypothetical protein WI75_03100 [Burkholderia ubonensis]KVD17647.1 hypothetical protein WI80_04070 [Burkholderia ubonensis]KVD33226.1 hypothetical protein WI84_21495 [Burkholderia ubonensis]KVU06598.1 hypothetical protein WK62_10840 [Burkholderia ubonensis]KVU23810.1 hypothetical protein WK63_28490 [Burkholderia ubonensis]